MSKPYFSEIPNFDYINRNPNKGSISDYVTVKNLFKRPKIRTDILDTESFFNQYSIVGDERPDNIAFKFYGDSTLDWIILLSNNIINIQSEWPLTQKAFENYLSEKYQTYQRLYSIHHYETLEVKNSSGITILPGGVKVSRNNIDYRKYIYPPDKPPIEFKIINSIPLVPLSAGTPDEEVILVKRSELANTFPNAVYGDGVIDAVTDNLWVYYGDDWYNITNKNYGKEVPYFIQLYDRGLNKEILYTDIIKEVSNYEYEYQLEEKKRQIYVLKSDYLNIFFNDLSEEMEYKNGSEQFVSRTIKKGDNIKLYT